MKILFFLMVIILIIVSCATTSETRIHAIQRDVIGQNEIDVVKILGMPTRVEHFHDGEKVIIYEFYSKGMFLTPNKSSITYNADRNVIGGRQGWTYTSNVNTVTNDPKYTIYPTYESYFKVYIDKHGKAVRIEQNLSLEQLEVYHERFKHFSPYK